MHTIDIIYAYIYMAMHQNFTFEIEFKIRLRRQLAHGPDPLAAVTAL